jgi:hypothetical protein
MGTGAVFPGSKNVRACEAEDSPASGAEVKKVEAIPPLPLHLHGVVLN